MVNAESGPLSQDLVFELLKSPRRRYVLYYLRQYGGRTTLGDVTDQVAAWENDVTVDELTSKQRKRVYISLYQTHLPKLNDAGVVNYDREEGTVELARRAREFDGYLGDHPGETVPWDKYYLGLSVVGILLLLAVWLNVQPVAALSELVTAIIIVIAFAVSAFVQHVYSIHRRAPKTPPELGGRTET